MSAERILVIEDDEKIADFLRRGLIYDGFKVEVAPDGEKGLIAARDRPPDVVAEEIQHFCRKENEQTYQHFINGGSW